jgi:hypothetical protein
VGSSFIGISETVMIGSILYVSSIPIPARRSPVYCIIVPIGGIHIFIGNIGDQDTVTMQRPAQTAFELDTLMEDQSGRESPHAGRFALDLKYSRPNPTALVQEIPVEDQCRSALASQV